jgi:hypothetical protein
MRGNMVRMGASEDRHDRRRLDHAPFLLARFSVSSSAHEPHLSAQNVFLCCTSVPAGPIRMH